MSRLLVIPLALFALLAGAMFWSGGGAEQRAEFAFINRGDIHTLDLNQMSYMQDFRLTYGIREGLYDLDPDTFRPIPAGATGHGLSDDKKVWTFHLRPACKWSNGDPVTARDYVFSWRRMLEEPGEYTYLVEYLKNASEYKTSYSKGTPTDFATVGVQAIDDLTLRVTLDNPVPYLLDLLAFPPFYPRHERSMARFRAYVDTDVMGPFAAWLKAGKGPAKAVDLLAATEAELVDGLAAYAAGDPLAGRPVEPVDPLITIDGDVVASAFDTMAPAEKLRRMVAGRFVRYSYNKAYTLPPDVVTNGPYTLERWDFKRRLLLKKSPSYWDVAHVRSATIEMVVAENPQSQLLLYESKAVDWQSEVSGEQGAELSALGRTDLRVSPAFGTAFLTLLCKDKLPASLGGGPNPLADVRVRQALALAIDKRWIVENVTRMKEMPARTYLPPDGTLPDFEWVAGPFNVERKTPYRFAEMQARLNSPDALTGDGAGLPCDPVQARKLLAEAGYPGGRNFPKLPLLFNSNSPARRMISQRLMNVWKEELGIEIAPSQVEGKIFQERVSSKDYAIATVAWYGDYPDMSTFTDKYQSGSLQNDSAWVNKEFDGLLATAAKEGDAARRMRMLSRAEHLIDTEVPIIPLYHYVNVSLNRDNVHGVDPNPRNITIFKHVWVDRKAGK